MKVRSGWNSEYARKKYDVEVDEADLARILTARGIPLAALGTLTMGEVHDILYYTAEGLARLALGRYDKNMAGQCAEDFRKLQASRDEVLARVAARWAPSEPGEPELATVSPEENAGLPSQGS
jgi:hypothetical protein